MAVAAAFPAPALSDSGGLGLADIGDLRAVPLLAERLKQDPKQLYGGETDAERRIRMATDERVSAARMIADLAELNPEQLPKLRSESEAALFSWLGHLPSPHANALRALVSIKSEQVLGPLRAWAFPTRSATKVGQQPPLPKSG